MFHVGQKIVCVDASDPRGDRELFSGWLTKDAIYTVRGVRGAGLPSSSPASGVFLEEIIGKTNFFVGEEWGWRSRRFRPLTERKTDISAFRSLLNPTKRQIRESIGLDLGFTLEEIGEE